MHFTILFIGNESELDKKMEKYCDHCGANPLKAPKCDYYSIVKKTTRGDIKSVGGELYGIIKGSRWHERRFYPADFYVNGKFNPKWDNNLKGREQWEKDELARWDKRGKALLKDIPSDQEVLILDVHN